MLTPQDTPTALDVLRGHQRVTTLRPGDGAATMSACMCDRTRELNTDQLAVHQLGVLQSSGLAVVSVHGTAGVVEAAAALVGAMRQSPTGVGWQPMLLRLRDRVEALGR